MRRALPGEDSDVEVSSLDALSEFAGRWLPVPTQLSCPFAVQVFLAQEAGGVRALLAVDTIERAGSRGRALGTALDEGRPFRALDKQEIAGFLDLAEARRRRAPARAGRASTRRFFKLAALLDVLAPQIPKLHFTRISNRVPVPVSLVLDFGTRAPALLVEARDKGMFALPLVMCVCTCSARSRSHEGALRLAHHVSAEPVRPLGGARGDGRRLRVALDREAGARGPRLRRPRRAIRN